MTDQTPRRRRPASREPEPEVTQLQIFKMVTDMRTDILVKLDEMNESLDLRMRDIEAAQPKTLGPRIEKLELWRVLSDGTVEGGLPVRIQEFENDKAQIKGSQKVVQAALWLASAALTGLTLYSWISTHFPAPH